MKSISTLFFSCLLFQLLSAQTWIRQNPFPQLAVIQDIHFDGLNGIAVGDESTILTTTNGGVNWIPRKAPQTGSLYRTALIVPGTGGQLMFAGGYQLIVSRDGGETWSNTSAQAQLIYKIQALPNGTIIVLDSDNGLISKDNGVTWDTFFFPGMNTSAGHFTTETNGWVVYGGFNNNQVWATTDGGLSWGLRDTLKHPVVSEVFMMDDLNGYLGSRDFVYKTNDGGHSWVKLHDAPVNSILDMHVVNEHEIWTCLNNGFIFYTLDGGTNWTETNPNIISSNQTPGIFANDEGKVWVAGKFVSIMYSSDFGMDWTDQIPSAKGIMYTPSFINENTGIIGSSEGTILKTTNGGASFEKLQLGPDEYFFSAQMISEQAMVVGSSSGRVFGSTDQGASWTVIAENLGQVSDIHAFSLSSAVLTTESGKIYKTENTGIQWDEVYSGSPDILLGLEFVDAHCGWACGWFGQILHTIDGGRNWTSQYHDGINKFADIHFTSATEGWVVSNSFTDTLWHTTNVGIEWEPLPLPYKTFWNSVSFTNQDTGWIAGGSAGFGIILRTNDGGQSWMFDHQSPEALFGLYAVPGKETAWATGFGGNVVKYSPCTFNLTLSNLMGEEIPCQYDTVVYEVTSSGVDLFDWDFPADWLIYGNPNTSSIQVIVGAAAGSIRVQGKDGCNNTTDELVLSASPIGVPQAIITENEGVLTCNLESGFFQWLKDGIPLPGAEDKTYTPVSSGRYEVVVTMFATGCQARSNPIDIFISNLFSFEDGKLSLYPNPTSGRLFFKIADGDPLSDNSRIVLINLEGKTLMDQEINEHHVDMSDLPNGFYLVFIRDDRRIYMEKIVLEKLQ